MTKNETYTIYDFIDFARGFYTPKTDKEAQTFFSHVEAIAEKNNIDPDLDTSKLANKLRKLIEA